MRRFLDAGYEVVKMKIGGADLAEDLRRIEAVIEVLDGDGSRLAVDVNGRFDLDTALAYGRAIDPYGLFWYEEVGDPLDYRLNATLAEHYRGPIATGENLFSLQDARNLDPLRRTAARPRLHPGRPGPELRPRGVPPHPGHARPARLVLAPLHPARRPPVLPPHRRRPASSAATSPTPGEFQPTGGFADDAVVEGSRVRLDDRPGIGFEGKAAFHRRAARPARVTRRP